MGNTGSLTDRNIQFPSLQSDRCDFLCCDSRDPEIQGIIAGSIHTISSCPSTADGELCLGRFLYGASGAKGHS